MRAIPAAPRFAGAAGIVTAAGFNTVRELAPYRERHVSRPVRPPARRPTRKVVAPRGIRPRGLRTCPASGRPYRNLGRISPLQDVEEPLLSGADLLDVDLVEAGVDVRLERGDVLVGVRAARHESAIISSVTSAQACSKCAGWGGSGRARRGARRSATAGGRSAGLLLVRALADLGAALHGLAPPPASRNRSTASVGHHGAEAVADTPGELGGLGPKPETKMSGGVSGSV